MADSFFAELKRRNVFKIGVAYAVVAWVLTQIITSISEPLNLPDWTATLVIVLLGIGFPIAVILAWAFEITPDGIKKESEIADEDSITTQTERKINFTIISLLIVAAGYYFYENQFDSGLVGEPEGSSIAVLPFINMSSDPEQEYFSDGISEEILNVLAKIPNLKVTSRSSAFSFKGKKIILSEVAKKLGVTNILEGSVRKSGNRIRITAQLIEAETDIHLWSETYDRELIDIFVIQDEISEAIVNALKSELGIEQQYQSRDMSQVNLDAHNEYLQGRYYIEKRTLMAEETALVHFDKSIEISPDYALAWVGKSWATAFLSEFEYGNTPHKVATKSALKAAEKALSLDPNLAEAHAVMGLIYINLSSSLHSLSEDDLKLINKGREYFNTAKEINPNYSNAYSWYGETLYNSPKEQLEYRLTAYQLNPLSKVAAYNYIESLTILGQLDEAEKAVTNMVKIAPSHFFVNAMRDKIELARANFAIALFHSQDLLVQKSPIRRKYEGAQKLMEIGLSNKAADLFIGTEFEVYQHYYKNNHELYISQTRAQFPRFENDLLGSLIRGEVEMLAGNYFQAIKYFNNSSCTQCVSLIYAYQQVGDVTSANLLLKHLNSIYHSKKTDGEINLENMALNLAFLSGNTSQAMSYLEQSINRGFIISEPLKKYPMYKALRAHPDWEKTLVKSNATATEQASLYLKLLADDKPL